VPSGGPRITGALGPLGVADGLTSVGVGAGWVGVALGTAVGGKGVKVAVSVGAAVVGVRRPAVGLGFLQPMMLTNKHTSSKMTVRLFMSHSNLCSCRVRM